MEKFSSSETYFFNFTRIHENSSQNVEHVRRMQMTIERERELHQQPR